MDPRLDDLFRSEDNQRFKIAFFPDRIFHGAVLNATRSDRYRYRVLDVRTQADVTVIKAEVFLDGRFLSRLLRVEYGGRRLVELAREQGRTMGRTVTMWSRLESDRVGATSEAMVPLHYCRWTDSYQVELWETLEAPPRTDHDYRVLDQMGCRAPITLVPAFVLALGDLDGLRQVLVAFREDGPELPIPEPVAGAQWDNNFLRTHEAPISDTPNAHANTVKDLFYYTISFQRGYFLDATAVRPVRYENAMMSGNNPDRRAGNIIEMRWLLQRELGGSLVFFHEVTIPPHTVEGTHHHIGSEELYYIVAGTGTAYMGLGDDPATDGYPTVERDVFGLGTMPCKELPVRPGNVIYTKSGGVHGIRNDGDQPLTFVAFLYHTV